MSKIKCKNCEKVLYETSRKDKVARLCHACSETTNERAITCTFLLKTAHDLSHTSTAFRGVYQYIRKRKKCPSKELFNSGIESMDKVIVALIAKAEEVRHEGD